MPNFQIADDYVEVAQRLRDLYAMYPTASLQGEYELVSCAGKDWVVYRARCYRTPDDPCPAVGTAWEPVPGPTPFTRDSEMQNAETSAWGRAIVAAGASETKRIASANEVQARQHVPAPKAVIDALREAVLEADETPWVGEQGFVWPWSDDDCEKIQAHLDRQKARREVRQVRDVLLPPDEEVI